MSSTDRNESKNEIVQDLLESLSKNYKILSVIGQGGMATVYKAENLILSNEVAIKVLNSEYANNESSRIRFLNEAKICSQLEHPNIVKIKSFGLIKESIPYIVMELLSGKNLAEFLQSKSRLSPQEFKEVFVPVLEAIEFAHSKGMIHRDITPSNIYLSKSTDDDKEFEVKVLDFGIAKEINSKQGEGTVSQAPQQKLTSGILGSPLYMSPEQAEGKAAEFRSDIYSLATVMFQAIEGKTPFEGETAYQTMYNRSQNKAPKFTSTDQLSLFPESLTNTIIKCLNKNPNERVQSISEFRKDLLAAFEEKDERQKRTNKIRQRSAVLPLGLALLLALSGIFIYKQVNDRKLRESEVSRLQPISKLQQFGKLKQAHSFGLMAFREAEELRERNLIPEAIEKYKEQIAEFSSKTQDRDDIEKILYKGHRTLADLYNQNNQPELAFAEYEKTLTLFNDQGAPNRINIFIAYANELTQHGQIKKAIAILKKNQRCVEENAPARSIAEYLATLANLEEKERNYIDAEKLNDKAIEEFERTRWGLCTTAGMNCIFTQYKVYKELHKEKKASDLIRRAKDSIPADAPKTPGAQFSMANHAKEYPELRELAIEYFKKAIETAALDDTPGEMQRIREESVESLRTLSQ